MQCHKLICQLFACILVSKMTCAYPQARSEQQSQRLSAQTDAIKEYPLSEHQQQFTELYKFEQTVSRLRRAVEQLEYEDTNADDLELAEINVFRPLFRYRASVSRQVKNPQQQQFG